MKCSYYFEVGPAVVVENMLIHTLCRCKYSLSLMVLSGHIQSHTRVWILANPFCVFAHKSRTVTWPIPRPPNNMGHQQRAKLHSRTTPVSLIFALHKDAADFWAILPFLIWEGDIWIIALRHAFCVYHMPLFSPLQIKESVTKPRHPKGCAGLPSAADMAKYNPQELSLFPVKN